MWSEFGPGGCVMLSSLFLGISLLGAEWVLYLLLILSILSISLIVERYRFYRQATHGVETFRKQIRDAAKTGQWDNIQKTASQRSQNFRPGIMDMESEMSSAILEHIQGTQGKKTPEILNEVAVDSILRAKKRWESNLAILATIGSNAPFVGLFGTVLGIIQAFNALGQNSDGGMALVTTGISEALIATAVGILVAIPAVVAFNLFQRKVKSAVSEAEALKSFLIGKLSA